MYHILSCLDVVGWLASTCGLAGPDMNGGRMQQQPNDGPSARKNRTPAYAAGFD